MSGPCTLEYLLIQGTILGAKAALESAAQIRAGIADARAQNAQAMAERAAEQHAQRERERASLHAFADRLVELEAALARMTTLAETLRPTLQAAGADVSVRTPVRPREQSRAALEAYASELEAAVRDAQGALQDAGAKLAAEGAPSIAAQTLARLAAPRSLADLIDAYLAANAEERRGEDRRARLAAAEQLLSPIADHVLPPAIAALVTELASAPNPARADALALELRRQVANERARRERMGRDREEALALLDQLEGADAHAIEIPALRQTLELVVAGLVSLDGETASRARSLAADIAAERARATQVAAAQVLELTLRDLGFVVEPIAHTLFVAGGVAHFTRPEWGEYAVRLRASDKTLNFNVVREASAARDDALSQHLRDARAESTWCEHIPKLTQTLEARGIALQVKRLLGAGEAPAQVVPSGTLRSLASEAAAAKTSVPFAGAAE